MRNSTPDDTGAVPERRCLGRRRRAPRHGNPARPHGSGRGTRYAWAAARGRRRERGIIQRRHVEVGVRRPVIHAETQRGLVVGLDDVAEWRERMLVERDAASDVPHMQCDVIQHTCHCTRSISHMTAVFYPLVIRYHPPKVPSRAEQMGLWADDGALRGMAGTAEDTTAMATGTANSHGTCFSPYSAQIILRDAMASQHHMARWTRNDTQNRYTARKRLWR